MKFFLLLLAFVLSCNAAAQTKPRPLYTIFSGTLKGTYIDVANDMRKACPEFDIQVQPTQGTLSNINSLILGPPFKAGYRIAFAQQDALDMIIGSEPRVKTLYKVISPMYTEEIMIIVNKGSGILGVRDLAGKKVAMGTMGSGHWFTSNFIKKQLKLKWVNFDNSPEEAMLMVLTGQVDAVIIVGGVPLQLFQELGEPMDKRIAIIPVHAPELDKFYKPSRIPQKTYLWADYPVDTKSTMSVMIAAADVPDTAIKELKSCLVKNLPAIQKFGHPKWSEMSKHLRQK